MITQQVFSIDFFYFVRVGRSCTVINEESVNITNIDEEPKQYTDICTQNIGLFWLNAVN